MHSKQSPANPEVITNWFKLYQEVLEGNNIDSALYVWNIDECGCIHSPKPKNVVCIKKIPANQLGPTETGETTAASGICKCSWHAPPTPLSSIKEHTSWMDGKLTCPKDTNWVLLKMGG